MQRNFKEFLCTQNPAFLKCAHTYNQERAKPTLCRAHKLPMGQCMPQIDVRSKENCCPSPVSHWWNHFNLITKPSLRALLLDEEGRIAIFESY